MSEEEHKEAAEERGNFVRMTRLLVEVAYPLMRAQFKQAHNDATGSEWAPGKGPLFWQRALDQGTKKRLKGDAGSKVKAGDLEAWDCTILLEMLINGVFKHQGQQLQVQCFEKRFGGGSAWSATLPIRHCRNGLFAHVATLQLPQQALQHEAAKLTPTLLKLHSTLDAKHRPFDDARAVINGILKGPWHGLLHGLLLTCHAMFFAAMTLSLTDWLCCLLLPRCSAGPRRCTGGSLEAFAGRRQVLA